VRKVFSVYEYKEIEIRRMKVAVVSIEFMCQKRHVTESLYYTSTAKNKLVVEVMELKA
jgi:hypothetical protein